MRKRAEPKVNALVGLPVEMHESLQQISQRTNTPCTVIIREGIALAIERYAALLTPHTKREKSLSM
ncbi:MAG: hypothetical protein LC742_08700 [Acidobacteria bacterium]|nr:hypothetical protein [Acidobacteriota bacterium]